MQAHDDHLAHHFQSQRQQFDAGKLGMWIFLLTEILLLAACSALRGLSRQPPGNFRLRPSVSRQEPRSVEHLRADPQQLDDGVGRALRQTDRRRGLIACLALTLACACGFLGVKAIEYRGKWREGLLWASKYDPKGAALREMAAPAESATAGLSSSVPRRAGAHSAAPARSASPPLAAKVAPAAKTLLGKPAVAPALNLRLSPSSRGAWASSSASTSS